MKYQVLIMVLFMILSGCHKNSQTEQNAEKESTMTNMDQKISEITQSDISRFEKQRAVIEAYLGDENSKQNYITSAGKLGLLRALLEKKVFKPDQTYEFQCMGVILGDAFVQELGMKWVIVEDQFGRDPAVQYGDSNIILYPLTMISKRNENGEDIDVFDLFNDMAEKVEELLKTKD